MQTEKGKLIGKGFTAQVYAWGDGRVLKLFESWRPAAKVEREFTITRAVHAAGLPVPAAHELVEVHRRPLGVVGSITPWNHPIMIAAWHIMPALVAGNTVVLKPSPYTPLSTLRLIEIANEYLQPGVLNTVSGEGGLGQAMAEHPAQARADRASGQRDHRVRAGGHAGDGHAAAGGDRVVGDDRALG